MGSGAGLQAEQLQAVVSVLYKYPTDQVAGSYEPPNPESHHKQVCADPRPV